MTSTYGSGSYGGGGYGGAEPNTPMTRNATLDMTLDLRGQLTVTVTDTADAPVADATVSLDGPTTGEATTDSEGVVVFAPIDVGAYSVRATFDGVEATGEVAESDFQ